MKTSELLALIGDDNLEIQGLAQNFDSAKIQGRNGKITFLTSPSRIMDLEKGEQSKWIGLMVWIPRSKMPTVKEGEG